MKRFITAAGLAALGAVSSEAQTPPVVTTDNTKPWSVSASLRAFYDDNYTTSPSDRSRDSVGFEFSPRFTLTLQREQTLLQLNYVYGLRYYEDRSSEPFDHTHQFDAFLRHQFTERYKIELTESFVLAQEPEVIDNQGNISVPLRTEGDNLRNHAAIDFSAQLSELYAIVLGYSNTYFDYEQDGFRSRSALLDRMQHLATVNLRYQIQRPTVGILGYQYGQVNYLSDEEIFAGVSADVRDNRSHYVYVGADHQFNPSLNGAVRLGGQYTDYYNIGETELSPYADASLTYFYRVGSHVQFGVRHARNATDVAVFDVAGTTGTMDQESTTFYTTLTHQITAKLTGNVLAQYQNSEFSGGPIEGERDSYYMLGLNLNYRFNNFWSAEAGYNFDRLSSDLADRSFTRNRVYVGVRVTY